MSIDLYGLPSAGGITGIIGGAPNESIAALTTLFYAPFQAVGAAAEDNGRMVLPRSGILRDITIRYILSAGPVNTAQISINSVLQPPVVILLGNGGGGATGLTVTRPLNIRVFKNDLISLKVVNVSATATMTLNSWAVNYE